MGLSVCKQRSSQKFRVISKNRVTLKMLLVSQKPGTRNCKYWMRQCLPKQTHGSGAVTAFHNLGVPFWGLGNFVSQSLWMSFYVCLYRLEKDVLGFWEAHKTLSLNGTDCWQGLDVHLSWSWGHLLSYAHDKRMIANEIVSLLLAPFSNNNNNLKITFILKIFQSW